jgi:hypothetical protein
MPKYLQEAFNQVCKNVKYPSQHYVVLMESTSFYGGPQEGGWWGHDEIVVAYEECVSEEEAEAKREAIETLAEELTNTARTEFGKQCIREMDWLTARGLDSDFLPEPDGPSKFHVTVTDKVPQDYHQSRHWD